MLRAALGPRAVTVRTPGIQSDREPATNVVCSIAGLAVLAAAAARGQHSAGSGWRAPDLIGREFGTERLNHKWYGDGTEVVTDEGKLYLDSVLDMGGRRIVGFRDE